MMNPKVAIVTVLLLLFTGMVRAEDLSHVAPSALVHTESWKEIWPTPNSGFSSREVTTEIWTESFQAALDKHHQLHIPAREKPYYIDAPLILRSGDTLIADSTAVIRLKPGTNTCMVRNENIVGFEEEVLPEGLAPDTNITIEGGIWTTLATGDKAANGNMRGHSSKQNYIPGTHGVILLHNVRNVTVRNITVRQSKAFAVHLGNARNFLIDGVTLDHHRRDGVHVNGPSSNGVIRNVGGTSHDDTVALNAWEWKGYAPTFGPIHHVTIERVSGAPTGVPSASSIRLLPGVKAFEDGKTVDCTISDITIRDITDIREFKFYDQPNLERGRDNDFSLRLGTLHNIRLQRLTFTRPGVIQIAANVDGMGVEDVEFTFEPDADFRLVEIGPMSMTWRHGDDPSRWVEVFSPDRDVTVRNFHLGKVRVNGQGVPDGEARFLQVKDQQINPDYPKTTPRGGTGKAILVP